MNTTPVRIVEHTSECDVRTLPLAPMPYDDAVQKLRDVARTHPSRLDVLDLVYTDETGALLRYASWRI